MNAVISSEAYHEHVVLFEQYERDLDSGEIRGHNERNAVLLHSIYFSNIQTPSVYPEYGVLANEVTRTFNSIETLIDTIHVFANIPENKWVLLSWDMIQRKIWIDVQNEHDCGALASIPLMALDLYEHAYWMDYGHDKQAYVAAFIAALNWKDIDRRLVAAQKLTKGFPQ